MIEILFHEDQQETLHWLEKHSRALKNYKYTIENNKGEVKLSIKMDKEELGKLLENLQTVKKRLNVVWAGTKEIKLPNEIFEELFQGG